MTGKVETLMCLVFPMAVDDGSSGDDEETGPEDLFQVIHTVLQTNVQHNYSDCSAR